MTARSRFRIAVAVAVVAVLVLAAPAAPAAAGMELPYAAPCATGAITDYAGTLGDGGAPQVSIGGWIQPCEAVPPTTRFAFVHYYLTAAVLPVADTLGTGLRGYSSPTEPTDFTVTARLDALSQIVLTGIYGPTRAICLVRNASTPLACVAVDHDSTSAAPPTVFPISTEDVRVQVPVAGYLLPHGFLRRNPYCGNCI